MKFEYKYLGNRQPYSNIEPVELDDCFRILRETFGDAWLDERNNNVLQKLWTRRDSLATRELFSLGFSIRALSKFSDFIKEKVELIKTNDPKNWNGALFEIFALSFFLRHNTVPAKRNQAGYDGVINLNTDKKIRLSIKNYSISKHHEIFLKESELINSLTQKNIQDYNCSPIEVIINKKNGYPSSGDWQLLKDNYHGIFIEYNKRGKNFMQADIGDWGVIVQGLRQTGKPYSNQKKSYTLILSAPFHTNEEKNIFDKLEEACANLVKHGGAETGDEKNMVIIHLPKIASRQNCEKWIKNYFELFPAKPISAVILYQPLVLSIKEGKGTYISNGISIISRESFEKDFESLIPLDIVFPMGTPETEFPSHKIFVQETLATAFEISLTNFYVFQQGHHYHDAQKVGASMEGSLNKVASGIFTHSIFEIDGQHVEFSGHFEPLDQLDIM
ncbi:hypothetical protein WG954_03840 [Lacibacter sp. H375]|uniref:hypothetical protein n=1 Tax=Lacibacter sp. H375 TaxID=3133424 RepID=UPI0030BAFCBF